METTNSECMLPPEDDPYVGYKIFEILDEILEDKESMGLPAKWRRSYELVKNKHWRNSTKSVSLVSGNLLFSHRQRTANLLTDNNPTFNVVVVGNPEESEEIRTKLHRTADFWWRDTEQQEMLEKSILRGETNGCAIEKVAFNPELEAGLGDAETVSVDPFCFGVYPVDAEIQKAEAVLFFTSMTVFQAKRRWPDKAEVITADDAYLDELASDRREISGMKSAGEPASYFGTFSGIIKKVASALSTSTMGERDNDSLLVVECWTKDRTQETKSRNKADVDGIGRPAEVREEFEGAKYPGFIRCIITCNGGSVVLEDKPNPSINPELPDEQARLTYLYDHFPFSRVPSLTDPENNWGSSDLEQLEGLQMEIDKSLSQFTTYKDRAARLKIINPKDSGVDNKEFSNASGIIRPISQMIAQSIRYMESPPPPADLLKSIEIYADFFYKVAGTFDLDQASTPGKNVIAYKAISALLEQTHRMVRGKERNYSRLIRERGRMYLSHVLNWYTEDRVITNEGDDSKPATEAVRGTDLVAKLAGPIKFIVVSGSTMPVSQVQKREEALTLFTAGAIDQTELLKTIEWSDPHSVVKRMQAGPIGAFIGKLKAIGVPDFMLQVFAQLGQMEDKDLQKAMEKGAVPTFEQLHQFLMQALSGQQKPEQPDPAMEEAKDKREKTLAEIKEIAAKIQKLQAETKLIEAKSGTEQVDQKAKLAGIQLDVENMKIERAKLVKEFESMGKMPDRGDPGRYNERGMKSNNKEG